jgi:hypothetical protein
MLNDCSDAEYLVEYLVAGKVIFVSRERHSTIPEPVNKSGQSAAWTFAF